MSQPVVPIRLSELPHETTARLVDIQGGRHLARRLLALGLRQGNLLTVVQRRGQGLVLASGEARIAVGAGIADKLLVTPIRVLDDGNPDRPASEAGKRPDRGQKLTPASAHQGL